MRPATILGLCLLGACSPPPPGAAESDPAGYRTIDIDYDEARLRVSAKSPLTEEENAIVLSLGRAATARYIEARSSDGVPPINGRFRGPLSLHSGWRQEFFPLARELYESTTRLPAGVLYFDSSPSGVARDFEYGWAVRGRSDRFSGFFTKVIEVPADAVYAFGRNTDDGSIGTLQSLAEDWEQLHVLWYEWGLRAMAPSPSEERVALEAGTYLLTVHYFEQGGVARYLLFASPQVGGDSIATPLAEPPPTGVDAPRKQSLKP